MVVFFLFFVSWKAEKIKGHIYIHIFQGWPSLEAINLNVGQDLDLDPEKPCRWYAVWD